MFKGIGYVLYLFGAAVGGFPPPRKFAREEQPAEELVRVLEDEFVPERRDILEEWGFRVVDPLAAPPREPRRRDAGQRPTLHTDGARRADAGARAASPASSDTLRHPRVPETPC